MFGASFTLANPPDTPMLTGARASAPGAGRAAVESESGQATRFGKSVRRRLSFDEPHFRVGGSGRYSPPTDLRYRLASRYVPYVRRTNIHCETHPERVRERVTNELRKSEEILKRLFKRADNLASTYSIYPEHTRHLLRLLTRWREQLIDHQQLLHNGEAYAPKNPSKKNTLASNRLKQEWGINRQALLLQGCCKKFIALNFPAFREGNTPLLGDDKKIEMISRQVELIDRLKKAIRDEFSEQKAGEMPASTATGGHSPLLSQSAGRAKADMAGAESGMPSVQVRASLEVRGSGWKYQADFSEQSSTATSSFHQYRTINAFIENIRERMAHSTPTAKAGASIRELNDEEQQGLEQTALALNPLSPAREDELSTNLTKLALKES